MSLKHGRELWCSLVYVWETSPYLWIELLLLMAGALSVLLALVLGYVWPFGFLALLFFMAYCLALLVRETMMPSQRERWHRLGAVVCFGVCLLLLLNFVRLYVEAYG